MIDIIVCGSGLIPRGNGIAPRLTPFKADKDTIKSILLSTTGDLKPYYVDPSNGHKILLTLSNYERFYGLYENSNKPVVKKVEPKKAEPVKQEVKVQEFPKKEELIKPQVEPPIATADVQEQEVKAEEAAPLVPINNPNNDDRNNGNHNNGNYNKHNKK